MGATVTGNHSDLTTLPIPPPPLFRSPENGRNFNLVTPVLSPSKPTNHLLFVWRNNMCHVLYCVEPSYVCRDASPFIKFSRPSKFGKTWHLKGVRPFLRLFVWGFLGAFFVFGRPSTYSGYPYVGTTATGYGSLSCPVHSMSSPPHRVRCLLITV